MKVAVKTLQELLMQKKNYSELKERIRMIKSQRTDTEKKKISLKKGKEWALMKLLDKII